MLLKNDKRLRSPVQGGISQQATTVCIKKNATQLYGLQKVFSPGEVGKNAHAA